MNWLWILVVILLIAGIILLSGKSPLVRKTREQFLQELAHFLEGTLESIAGEAGESSFRIRFQYDGQECVYEDLEKQGFKRKVYEAYLKTKTPSKLTLTFTEKERSMKITTNIFIVSEIQTQYVDQQVRLEVPQYLKDMNVFTNDPNEVNKILEDNKTAAVLRKFKNVDPRGYPFLSIGILEGVVVLVFHSSRTCEPNIANLRSDIPSIDSYLEKLMPIVRKLNE